MRSNSLKRRVILAVAGTVMLPLIGGGCLGGGGGLLRQLVIGGARAVGATTIAPAVTNLLPAAPAAPAP